MNRRTFMMKNDLDQLCVDGVNYSVQPDNEIWYTTIDNNKSDATAILNNYGGDRDILILAHHFENGVWRVKTDRPIVLIPQRYIQNATTIVEISLPNKVTTLNAWSMGLSRRSQYSPNLRTVILSSIPKFFDKQFQPFQCGDLDIYVLRGRREEFFATGIITRTPSNRVYEWGRI